MDEKSNFTFELKVAIPSGGKAVGRHTIEVLVVSEMDEKNGGVPDSKIFCLDLNVEGGTILGVSYLGFGLIIIIITIILYVIFW